MKFHVKFQGLFWFCEISYKQFGEYFGHTKNKRKRDQCVKGTFRENLITYPMHEEEMLKSKYYKDSLSDSIKYGSTEEYLSLILFRCKYIGPNHLQ